MKKRRHGSRLGSPRASPCWCPVGLPIDPRTINPDKSLECLFIYLLYSLHNMNLNNTTEMTMTFIYHENKTRDAIVSCCAIENEWNVLDIFCHTYTFFFLPYNFTASLQSMSRLTEAPMVKKSFVTTEKENLWRKFWTFSSALCVFCVCILSRWWSSVKYSHTSSPLQVEMQTLWPWKFRQYCASRSACCLRTHFGIQTTSSAH